MCGGIFFTQCVRNPKIKQFACSVHSTLSYLRFSHFYSVTFPLSLFFPDLPAKPLCSLYSFLHRRVLTEIVTLVLSFPILYFYFILVTYFALVRIFILISNSIGLFRLSSAIFACILQIVGFDGSNCGV